MLEQQKPPFPLHIVWFLVILLLLLFIVWASVSKVDKIVTADGKIITSRPALTMKPLEKTIIKTVNVRVGQRVKKGDILFTFDPTINQQELDRLREQLDSFQASSERMRAEMSGYRQAFVLPEKPNKDQLLQMELYLARKEYFLQKVRSYDEALEYYRSTEKTYEAAMNRYLERREKLAKIDEMMAFLEKENAVTTKEMLETQISLIETEISIDQMKVSL